MWSQFLAQVVPALIDVLTPILVTAIFALVYRWTGVAVEQKHMLALQSALSNGARLLLTGKTVEDAVGYVQRSVPDALAALKAQSPERISELLAPHIAALPQAKIPLSSDLAGNRKFMVPGVAEPAATETVS